MDLKERLKEIKRSGTNFCELAEMMNIRPATISAINKGSDCMYSLGKRIEAIHQKLTAAQAD